MADWQRAVGEPVFVGRDAELAVLRSAADSVAASVTGGAAVVAVTGPPQIGKSELLLEFARTVTGFRLVPITGFADEADLAYGLVGQLTLALRPWRPDAGWSRTAMAGDPVAVGLHLLEALSDAAAERPVLLLIDDLHHADPESAMVLRFLLRRMSADRICAVVTLGTERPATLTDLLPFGASTVTLAGLSEADVADWTELRWGRRDGATVTRVWEWTGGNPGWVAAVLADPSGGPILPAEVLRPVIERLSAPARATLEALSILGGPVAVSTLSTVAAPPGGAERGIEPAIKELIDARLVRRSVTDPHSVDFVDPAVSEATVARMAAATRKRLHAAAASVVGGRSERLAHLVAASSQPDDDLAALLRRESDIESDLGNLVSAARYAGSAAAVAAAEPSRVGLLTKAVRLFVRAGRDADALELADRVAALPPTWERDEALGLIAFARGEPATALPLLTRSEHGCPADTTPDERARIAAEVATIAVVLFSGPRAVEASERARALSGNPDIVALTAATGAFGRALIDGPAAGLAELAYLPSAPADCPERDLPGLTFRGTFRGLVGKFPEAVADLTVAARRREATRLAVFGVTAHLNLAWCQFLTGLAEVAEQTITVALELVEVYGRPYDHAALRSELAILRAWRGDAVGAREELAESVRRSSRSDFLGSSFHQVLAEAVIAWVEGNHGEVVARLAPMLRRGVDPDRVGLYAMWWLPLLADAQLSSGRSGEAAATVDRLERIDAVPGSLRGTAVAWLTGRIAAAGADVLGAVRILAAEVGRPEFPEERTIYSGLVLQALGEAQLAAGDRPAARKSLISAAATLEAMGAGPKAVRARALSAELLDEPVRPRRPTALDRLTDKERQIAALVGRGWTNPEIARSIFISTKTVEYHLRNIFMKLHLTSRGELRNLYQSAAAD